MYQTIEELLLSYQPKEKIENKKPPSWDKFYSVYMFDEIKYHQLCKIHPYAERNQLREQCYVLDENGQKIHLGDEDGVYDYQDFINCRQELSKYAENNLNVFKDSDSYRTKYYTLYCERYTEDKYTHTDILTNKSGIYNGQKFSITEVELNDTWNLSLIQRIKMHKEVLKRCQKGESIEDSCNNVLATYRKEDIMK